MRYAFIPLCSYISLTPIIHISEAVNISSLCPLLIWTVFAIRVERGVMLRLDD